MSAKEYALVLIPKFSGAISVTFSSLIIYAVIKRIRLGKSTVYDRLIMGMSFSDLLSSFWMSMSSWPIPKSSGVLWAVGNQTTCNLQGFFTHGTVASPIYNASLSFYHLLVVRYKWKNHGLKKYEWCFHFLPVAWSVSTAIAGIPLELYNNANLWCFIAATPDGERGQNASFFRMLFFYGPLYLMITIVTVNTLLVVCYVQKITTKAMHHSNSIASNAQSDDDDESSYGDESSLDEEEKEEERIIRNISHAGDGSTMSRQTRKSQTSSTASTQQTGRLSRQTEISRDNRYAKWRRRVAVQNLRYAIAFYWTWVPISAVRMLQIFNYQVPFWLIIAASFTCPMQGLANLLVYFYPAYMKLRKRSQETGSPLNIWKWINAGMQTSVLVVGNGDENHRHHHGHHGDHLRAAGDEELGKQAKVITPSTIEHATRIVEAHPSMGQEEERSTLAPSDTLKKDESNTSHSHALESFSSKRQFQDHPMFDHTMSSITVSGVLSEALDLLESGQGPMSPPLASSSRPSRGLPSTSSITLSEMEPVGPTTTRYSRFTSSITLSDIESTVDDPTSSLSLERENLAFSEDKVPPSTPRRSPSLTSGTGLDGDVQEDGRPTFGRKVSFKEDRSTGNSQQSVDQSPRLPDRNASKPFIEKDLASQAPMTPPASILKMSNRQAAMDSLPDQPRRTASRDPDIVAHISDAAAADSKLHDNGGRRFFGMMMPNKATSMKRQTSNATTDSTPTLPRRPVSEDASLVEVRREEQKMPRFPKPLMPVTQRQLSIDSDCAPKLPKRPASDVSLVERDVDNDEGISSRMPSQPLLTKATTRQTSNANDSVPSIPSRPVSSVSPTHIDDKKNEDRLPRKSFPEPLSSKKRRQSSIDSDSIPVLPRRPQSDVILPLDEEGCNNEQAASSAPMLEQTSPPMDTTTKQQKPAPVHNDLCPNFPRRPISVASTAVAESGDTFDIAVDICTEGAAEKEAMSAQAPSTDLSTSRQDNLAAVEDSSNHRNAEATKTKRRNWLPKISLVRGTSNESV